MNIDVCPKNRDVSNWVVIDGSCRVLVIHFHNLLSDRSIAFAQLFVIVFMFYKDTNI